MARGAQPYEQQLGVPDAPRGSIAVSNPEIPNAGGTFAALSAVAGEVQKFAVQQYRADQEAEHAGLRANYLTSLRDLENQYVQSTDFSKAPGEFEQARQKLTGDTLASVGDWRAREALRLQLTVPGLSSQNKVNAAALERRHGQTIGGLDVETADLQTRAATAGSPAEQAAMRGTAYQAIDRAFQAGAIGEQEVVRRKRVFDHSLSAGDAAKLMQADPAKAMQALDNPDAFPGLTAAERVNMRLQAEGAYDERERLRAGDLARRDPPLAAARYGVVTSRAHADQLFNAVIVPQESGGDPNAVSPAGAIGLGQLMPGTARDVARKLGKADVAGLDDAALVQRLKSDTGLNVQLGQTYWADQLKRYGGNVWAAAAAYNAGPGNADKPRADAWDRQAREKFGDHYTPAQLASVIPIKETHDYVLLVARRIGVDPGAMPLSFRGSYGAAATVSQVLATQANEQKRLDNEMVSLTAADRNSVVAAFQEGYEVNPQAVQAAKQPLVQAASRGDPASIAKLREFEEMEATYPLVQQAYKLPPEEVAATVALLQTRAAKGDLTGADMRRLDVLEKVADTMSKARDENPVGLAERQMGPGSVTRIGVPENVRDPAFAEALAARGVVAGAANKTYGGEFKLFKPEEASALKPWFAGLDAPSRLAAIGAMAQALPGRAFDAAIEQIGGGTSVTPLVARMARDRPELAADVFRGQALLQTEGVKNKMGDVRSALANKLGGQVYISADQQGAVVDTALALYTARRGTSGDLYADTDGGAIEKAIEDVAGPIVKRNGVKVAAPVGMTAGQFTGLLDNLDQSTLDQFGGAYDRSGKPFDPAFIGSRAALRQLEPGGSRYVVVLPTAGGKDQPVWQAPDPQIGNRPLVIDMSNIRSRKPVLPQNDFASAAAPFVAETTRGATP